MGFSLIFSFFLIGIFFGSFLNVLADRLPRNKSILGRSHCDYCHRTLKWHDLVPIVSYVFLKGHCRYCKKKLSIQYPLSEILTGLIFASAFLFTGSISSFLIYILIIFSCLIVIFLADLRHGIIPDKIVVTGLITSLIWLIAYQPDLILSHVISAVASFLFFLFLFAITKGKGMGFGDVKLSILIGLFLGFPLSVSAFYIAFLTGGMIGLILILWRKKKLKGTIPFGPFMVLGTYLSLFFQGQILALISHFF